MLLSLQWIIYLPTWMFCLGEFVDWQWKYQGWSEASHWWFTTYSGIRFYKISYEFMPHIYFVSLIWFIGYIHRLKMDLLMEKISWFLLCLRWVKSRYVPWRTSVLSSNFSYECVLNKLVTVEKSLKLIKLGVRKGPYLSCLFNYWTLWFWPDEFFKCPL